MADFKEFGEKAAFFARSVADKASETVEVEKLKGKSRAYQKEIEEKYLRIGKLVYGNHKEGSIRDEQIGRASCRERVSSPV